MAVSWISGNARKERDRALRKNTDPPAFQDDVHEKGKGRTGGKNCAEEELWP
jgi:hypothetical protein